MISKHLITMILALFILCSFINSGGVAKESRRIPPLPPIFDGNIGNDKPPLHLSSNWGHIEGKKVDLPKGTPGIDISGGAKIKSSQWTAMVETWRGSGIEAKIIRRFFEYEEDAINFPRSGCFMTNNRFSGWDNNPEWAPLAKIGEKTYWILPSHLYFVKGKVFIELSVHCRQDLGTQFTERIARNIEKKL